MTDEELSEKKRQAMERIENDLKDLFDRMKNGYPTSSYVLEICLDDIPEGPVNPVYNDEFLRGIKDPVLDSAKSYLLVESHKRKQIGYDITKGKYLNDIDPLNLPLLLSDKKKEIMESLKKEIAEKCTTISYDFDEPSPRLIHAQLNQDGSIGDVKFEF